MSRTQALHTLSFNTDIGGRFHRFSPILWLALALVASFMWAGMARAEPNAGAGGPLIAAGSAEGTTTVAADAQFRSLFDSWKQMDTPHGGAIAIPAIHPVDHVQFSSTFGVRSDPFRGTAAMHAGVDIPGPIGTPVYATADGIVSRAERAGGYGNLVEINHGRGIATRYGHLSKILVSENAHVKRGQLIALMGSTGRSTGSHLHYEVRIDGRAVNPMPFLQTADFLETAKNDAVVLHQTAAQANMAELQD